VLIGTSEVTTNGRACALRLDAKLQLAGRKDWWVCQFNRYRPCGNTSELSECRQVTGTSPATGPTITSACKGDGKQLVINGSGFVDGAKVLINGEVEKKIVRILDTGDSF